MSLKAGLRSFQILITNGNPKSSGNHKYSSCLGFVPSLTFHRSRPPTVSAEFRALATIITFLALFIPVTALTLLAHFGGGALARQRDELLPLLNFEPFVYLLFLFAGLSILFEVRSRFPRWFATFFMVPFAGALSGWSFGLTLVVLLQGMWRSTLFGVALTAFVAVFCLSPVFITRVATGLAQEIRGKLFPSRHHLLVVNGMGVIFLAAGAVGLWGLYGG